MKKKFLILSIILILIGIGIIIAFDFNYSIEYGEAKRIDIYIGKVVDINEIRSITNEVFNTRNAKIQKVEIFNDMVTITLKNLSDENIEALIAKINEKYELEYTTEDISVTNIPKVEFIDLIKKYTIPLLISFVVIEIYYAIRYKRLGIVKVISNSLLTIILSIALYISLIGITRIPVSSYTAPIGLLILLLTMVYISLKNEKKLEIIIKEESK